MSFLGGIKKIIRPLMNVPKWVGYQQLRKSSQSVTAIIKDSFIPKRAQKQETFEEALLRLGLKEADLTLRIKEFTRLMWVWIALFVVVLSYSIYLLSQHFFRGFFPSLAVALITLAQIFRYHFWIFQIKRRQLGCRFLDWLRSPFLTGKKNNEKTLVP